MPSGTHHTLAQGQETARTRRLHASVHAGFIRDVQPSFVHQSTGVERREVTCTDSPGEERCPEP